MTAQRWYWEGRLPMPARRTNRLVLLEDPGSRGRERRHLAARYETVVVEDLNVTGMLANRKLARAVADQGFGTVRRMLSYKTAWRSGQLVIADRWYPSSKTCSACGWRESQA